MPREVKRGAPQRWNGEEEKFIIQRKRKRARCKLREAEKCPHDDYKAIISNSPCPLSRNTKWVMEFQCNPNVASKYFFFSFLFIGKPSTTIFLSSQRRDTEMVRRTWALTLIKSQGEYKSGTSKVLSVT